MFVLLPLTPTQYFWAALCTILFASAPDWDLRLGIPHRTITHSLLIPFALYIAMLFIPVARDALYVTMLILVNHDLLDLLTWAGVPLFYPLSQHKFKLYIWSTIPKFRTLDYDTQKRIYTTIVNVACLVVIAIAVLR